MSPSMFNNNNPNNDDDVKCNDDDKEKGELTTDCPPKLIEKHDNKTDHNNFILNKTDDFLINNNRLKEPENDSDTTSETSQKITIESIKGHSDDDDDASSVVTDSSLSDYEENQQTIINGNLKARANHMAIDAINCASDRLQNTNGDAIVVNSEVRAGGSRNLESRLDVHRNGNVNNGFVQNESYQNNSNMDNRLAVPSATIAQSLSATSQNGVATAIFNDSTDITLGNKTFITGSLTIKQYIKDGTSNSNPEDGESDDLRSRQMSTKQKIWILIAIMAAIAIIGGSAVIIVNETSSSGQLKPGDGDDFRYNIPINTSIGQDLITSGTALRMVSRGEWIAQPPNNDLNNLKLPVGRIIIAHTATDNCTSQADCVFRVRIIQTYHMESRNFDDIGYNFLVGGDGAAYEGRGWDKEGAHTKGYNKGSICIAFIGTFTRKIPPERQLKVAQRLIEQGVILGKVKEDYKLYGHRQFFATESPGNELYNIIKTWPHWSDDIEDD